MNTIKQFAEKAEQAVALEDQDVEAIRQRSISVEAEGIKSIADSAIVMGEAYLKARDTFPLEGGGVMEDDTHRPGWREFAEENYQISHTTVTKFIRTYRASIEFPELKNKGLELLAILSSSRTTEGAKQEIIERIKQGDDPDSSAPAFGYRQAHAVARKHREQSKIPSPNEARSIARDTGIPTAASDGHTYLGATKDQEEAAKERMSTIYGIRSAIHEIADLAFRHLTPADYINLAAEHERWWLKADNNIREAADWLSDFMVEVEGRDLKEEIDGTGK